LTYVLIETASFEREKHYFVEYYMEMLHIVGAGGFGRRREELERDSYAMAIVLVTPREL